MTKKTRDRRRYPRFDEKRGTKISLIDIDEISLLNISLGGMLIEHDYLLRPGTIVEVVFPLAGRRLRLRCLVVWSTINRSEVRPDGEQELIFRTGIRFLEVSPDTDRKRRFLQAVNEGGHTKCARE